MLFLINRRKNLRDAITQTIEAPKKSLNTAYIPPATIEQRLAAALTDVDDFPLPPPPCNDGCQKKTHYVDPNLPLGAVPKRTSSLSTNSVNIPKRQAPPTPRTNAKSAARTLNQEPLQDISDDVFLRTQSFRGSSSTFGQPNFLKNDNYYPMHQLGSQSSVQPLLSNMVGQPPPPPLDRDGFQTAEFQFEK